MNHYCDIWFWRASDQEAVARHLRDRDRTTSVPDTPRRASLLRSALLSMLRMTGLTEQPVQARPVEQEETPVRESCDCGGEEEFQYREAILDDGEWAPPLSTDRRAGAGQGRRRQGRAVRRARQGPAAGLLRHVWQGVRGHL